MTNSQAAAHERWLVRCSIHALGFSRSLNMKFRITWFYMIEPSLCVIFFPMYFLISTQKTEENFQILQLKLLLRVCNGLKLNLCPCYFSLWKEFILFQIILFKFIFKFILLFLYKTLFFRQQNHRTFNMFETGGIVIRRSVYLFILPWNYNTNRNNM